MSIKGNPSQKKLTNQITPYSTVETQTTTEYVTAQPTSSNRIAMDIVNNGVYRIGALRTTEVGSIDLKRIIICTAHNAKKGDVIRFQTSAANPGFEASILSVPDTDTIILAAQLDADIDEGTDQFYVLRHVTAAFDSNGNVQVSQGPVQFVLDGSDTEVMQDTAVPANSLPLPVLNLNSDGTPADLALEATLQQVKDSLATIETLDFATETTLNDLNIKVTKADTDDVIVTASALPAGASTSALQVAEAILIGAVNETAPLTDTAASGVNGRLQKIAQNLTSLQTATTGGTQKTQLVDNGGANIDTLNSGTGLNALNFAMTATQYVISTANSTVAQLGSGATFTGTIETVFNQQAASILLTSDQNGTLTLKQYIDAAGLRQTNSNVYTITAGTPFSRSFVVNGNYFNLTFQNNGGSATTTLNINTAYGTLPAATNFGNGPVSIDEVGGTAITLGAKTAAASFPVVLSSDVSNSGNITTQNLVPAGTATANSAVLTGTLNGQNTLIIQVTGTYTGALSVQGTVDNTTWVTLTTAQTFTNAATSAQAATITSAAVGIFKVECSGYVQMRVTGLAAVTGTAVVTIRASNAGALTAFSGPIPTGTNTIGALTANQSVNAAQINGVAPLMGVGPSGTGALRITHSNTATATLANVAASATNVTLQASNANRRSWTCYNDSTVVLYVKFGATASATSFTVQVPPSGYFEAPQPIYSGIIDGIWASATGSARMTEW